MKRNASTRRVNSGSPKRRSAAASVTKGSESWKNFREWVVTALNVFLAPDGLEATDEAIDTFSQLLECRARELAAIAKAESR